MLKSKSISCWLVTIFIMTLVFGLQQANAAIFFTDINGHWAQSQIENDLDRGIVSGYSDNTFRPDNLVTRAEFVAMANRAFLFKNTSTINYPDVQSGDWFAAEIAKAQAARYISGYSDGTFRANNPISRQEVAVIMTKILKLDTFGTADIFFTDAEDIPAWSRNAIAALVKAGILGGYADGSFKPEKPLSRAEAAVIFARSMGSHTVPDITPPPVIMPPGGGSGGGHDHDGGGPIITGPMDGGGLNYFPLNWAVTPNMTVFNGELYVTWVENSLGITQVRIKKYNSTSEQWIIADLAPQNHNPFKSAYNPILMVYNGTLYVAWYEIGSSDFYQVYVKHYDNQLKLWVGWDNLSFSSNKAFNVKLAVYNNELYALWVEKPGTETNKDQIRAKKFNGTTWVAADGGASLNYDPNLRATLPTVEVANGTLFAAWAEAGNIKVKQYNSSWSPVNNGQSLNYDINRAADMPILVNCGSLYAIWVEVNSVGIDQVRAKKYNGSSWDDIDSGSLNYSPGSGAKMINAGTFKNTLYAAWTEKGKVRIKTYNGSAWLPAANDGILNYDPSRESTALTLKEYNGQLYAAWQETNGTAEQIRVKVIAP